MGDVPIPRGIALSGGYGMVRRLEYLLLEDIERGVLSSLTVLLN